jgi:hypothetical protein
MELEKEAIRVMNLSKMDSRKKINGEPVQNVV